MKQALVATPNLHIKEGSADDLILSDDGSTVTGVLLGIPLPPSSSLANSHEVVVVVGGTSAVVGPVICHRHFFLHCVITSPCSWADKEARSVIFKAQNL